MPFLRTRILLLLIAAVMLGCSGSKKLSKRGDELSEAGLYHQAAELYYNALLRNRANVDALIGLTAAGQRVLDDKYGEFTRLRTSGDAKAAVYAWLDATTYSEKLRKAGVQVREPSYLEADYQQVRTVYLHDLYTKGSAHLGRKEFEEAQRYFDEIARLDPEYKDAATLGSSARNEPIYQEALTLFDREDYRQAYYKFQEVLADAPNYKDARLLSAECLDKGSVAIAVITGGRSTNGSLEDQLQSHTVTALLARQDPFLKVVERENTAMLMREQNLSLSSVVDQRSAVEIGRLIGAKAILSVDVISFEANTGRLQRREKEGFEAYRVKLYNKAEDKNYYETRYRPVSYSEYYQTNEVKLNVQFKLVSLETGEVLMSKIYEEVKPSQVYYATYTGEATRLYPAGAQNTVGTDRERAQLQSLIRANRVIKSTDELRAELMSSFSTAVAGDTVAAIAEL